MVEPDFEQHIDRMKAEFFSGLTFLKKGLQLWKENRVLAGGPSQDAYLTPLPQIGDP